MRRLTRFDTTDHTATRHWSRCAAGAVLIVVAGCSKPQSDAAVTPASSSATPSTADASLTFSAEQVRHGDVKWDSARATFAPSVLELPAQLAPDDDQTAYLGAPGEGRVVTVHVRPGDRVNIGQPLVTLQSGEATAARSNFAKATAGVAAARASAAFARTDRERTERLLALKSASRSEVERAQTEDDVARSALQQAEAELARARAVRTQLGATSESGAMIVRSPLRGIVLSRDAAPGSIAKAGAPLVSVTDPTTLWLGIAVPDRSLRGIRAGMRVTFRVPSFPDASFEARIQSVGGALDSGTRTIPVRAVVKNIDGRLRPAMFATALIDGGDARLVIVLPRDAVQLLDNHTVVFIAHPDGKGGARFEHRDVEVGSSSGDTMQVVRGLEPGDIVVTGGAFAIKSEFARAKMAGG